MTTFYIYEIPGHKNGATKDLYMRKRYSLSKYGAEPIIIETIEGPDTEDMWQLVGDREWELADQNGYPRGEHYRAIRIRSSKYNLTPEDRAKGRSAGSLEKATAAARIANIKKRSLTFKEAEEIRAKWIPYKYGWRKLAEEYNTTIEIVSSICNYKTYLVPDIT